MKKVISLLLLLTLLLSLCACGSTQEDLTQFCIGTFSTPQDDCFLIDILTFYPGGSCDIPYYTWEISDGVFNLIVSGRDGVNETYGFAIDTEEKTLTALFMDNVIYYKDN